MPLIGRSTDSMTPDGRVHAMMRSRILENGTSSLIVRDDIMEPEAKSDAKAAAKPTGKATERLKELVDQTLSEFDVDVVWNVRTDLDTISQAKVLARQIAKHGGLRGMERADAIERELLSIGETPWR
jgi:hypothetical protein